MWTLVLVMVAFHFVMVRSTLPVCCPEGYFPTAIMDIFEIKEKLFYLADIDECVSLQNDGYFYLNLTCDSRYSEADLLLLQEKVNDDREVLNHTVVLQFNDVCFNEETSEFGFCHTPSGDEWKEILLESLGSNYTLILDDMFDPPPVVSWEIRAIDFTLSWVLFGCTRASTLFLVITSIIYSTNKNLRSNTHAAYVVSYSICLGTANALDFTDWSIYWLWKVQLNGFVSLYFNLATYFWMNAMILEVHFTLRSMQQENQTRTTGILKCSALLIWAIPLSLVTTAIWVKYYLANYKLINFFTDPIEPNLYNDGFVKYFNEYGPILLILAVNLALIMQTVISVLPKKSTSIQVRSSKHDEMSYDVKFIFLALYAWVAPLIITAIALMEKVLELGSNPDLSESINSWKISRCLASACFLESGQHWIYFTGPVTVLFLINLVLFLVNIIELYKHKKSTSSIISREDSKAQNKRYFLIYVKLFVVSGVCWGIGSSVTRAANYISWYEEDWGETEYGIVVYRWVLFYIPMLLVVSCQGLFVSTLFVYNEKTIQLLRQDARAFWNYLSRWRMEDSNEIGSSPPQLTAAYKLQEVASI